MCQIEGYKKFYIFKQMIQSMTGYGVATLCLPYKEIKIEIKSLNSKQLDLNLYLPRSYKEKEMDIRQLLFQFIVRGRVEVTMTEIYNIQTLPNICLKVFENYFYQVKHLTEKLQIPFSPEFIASIMSLPKVIDLQSTTKLDIVEWEDLKQTFIKALKDFSNFRLQEGKMLEDVFKKKIQIIFSLIKEINQYESERIEKIRTKLLRVFQNIQTNDYEKTRLEQELFYYIEKFDFQEEKSRLEHHLNYFLQTIKTEKHQGRKLGFIAQEINREINTLGSKSNHLEIQKLVVQIKNEIEQVKEQILNVL